MAVYVAVFVSILMVLSVIIRGGEDDFDGGMPH